VLGSHDVDELELVPQDGVALVEHVEKPEGKLLGKHGVTAIATILGPGLEHGQGLHELDGVAQPLLMPLELQRQPVLGRHHNAAAHCLQPRLAAVHHVHLRPTQLHVAVKRQPDEAAAEQAGGEVAVQVIIRLAQQRRQEVEPDQHVAVGDAELEQQHRDDDARPAAPGS
jgi:hypothetical protein